MSIGHLGLKDHVESDYYTESYKIKDSDYSLIFLIGHLYHVMSTYGKSLNKIETECLESSVVSYIVFYHSGKYFIIALISV